VSKRKDLTVFFIDTGNDIHIRYDEKDGHLLLKDGPQLKRFADELKKLADHLFLLYQSSCLRKQLQNAKLYHTSISKIKDHDLETTGFEQDMFANKYEA
jgi:hypothetical protein